MTSMPTARAYVISGYVYSKISKCVEREIAREEIYAYDVDEAASLFVRRHDDDRRIVKITHFDCGTLEEVSSRTVPMVDGAKAVDTNTESARVARWHATYNTALAGPVSAWVGAVNLRPSLSTEQIAGTVHGIAACIANAAHGELKT